MQLTHTFAVPLSPDATWRMFLDVEDIAPCMPGAVVAAVSADGVEGRVSVKLGAATVSYQGRAEFVERDESARRIVLSGRGRETRGTGTASVLVTIALHDDDGGGSRVVVDTDLKVTGKPAQFGRGIMTDVGDALLGRFAAALAERIVAQNDPAEHGQTRWIRVSPDHSGGG